MRNFKPHIKEAWRDVIGWEGYYQVSDIGRVKGLERMVFSIKTGKLAYIQKEKIIVQHGKKYKQVNLYRDSKLHHYYVHILMAQAWIPNPHNKPEVNHKDGDCRNNVIDNLEWATRSENIQHSYDIGIRVKKSVYGKDNPLSRPILQLTINGEFLKKWDCISDASKSFLPKTGAISNCCRGKLKTSFGYKWKYYE
jgi:hypothetical protein